jgi:hypothetical protein
MLRPLWRAWSLSCLAVASESLIVIPFIRAMHTEGNLDLTNRQYREHHS